MYIQLNSQAPMVKSNKTITISILDPIKPGMNPDQFTDMLQKKIYEEIDNII